MKKDERDSQEHRAKERGWGQSDYEGIKMGGDERREEGMRKAME